MLGAWYQPQHAHTHKQNTVGNIVDPSRIHLIADLKTLKVSLSHTFGSIQSQLYPPKILKLIPNFSDNFTDFQVTLPELLPILRCRHYALRGVSVKPSSSTLRDLDWAPSERPIAVLLEEQLVPGVLRLRLDARPQIPSWNKLMLVLKMVHQKCDLKFRTGMKRTKLFEES